MDFSEENNNPFQDKLQDMFADFGPEDAAPEELKKEVFKTLDSINLVADMIDLFTAKFTISEAGLLDITQAKWESTDNQ